MTSAVTVAAGEPAAAAGGEATAAIESAAEWVETGALHPWSKNPRRNTDAIGSVAKSIKRFGFGAPILARLNGEIIAGHTRWAAAKSLGLERVPVRYLDLDPAEAHVLALADNKLGEIAQWDNDLLREVLSAAQASDVDVLDGTGFSTDAIDAILRGVEVGGGEGGGGGGGEGRDPEPVIAYNIIFDSAEQQNRWFEFLRKLKAKYPKAESIAERLVRFLDEVC